ncbi:MAG: HNH/ENDO VII family nuclease [Alphaproteobacteria bacterium]|nr:HNH/ENDO VII family nuclease [Alphaproteobacteria bacterium]
MDKGDVDGAIAAGVAVGMAAVPGQKLIPAPLRKAVHGVVTKSVTRILHSKYGQAAVKAGGELVDAASSKVQNLSKRVADSSLVKGAGKKLEDWSVSKGGKGIVQQTEKGVDLSPRVKQNHWNDVDHFTAHGQTNKVYKRDDLIDLNRVDPKGRTNAERMANNLAPIGPDNKPINLHHMIQTQDGAIAEVTQTFHKKYSKIIHINPSTTPSGIDRPFFNKWRDDYWPYRLQELKGGKQ